MQCLIDAGTRPTEHHPTRAFVGAYGSLKVEIKRQKQKFAVPNFCALEKKCLPTSALLFARLVTQPISPIVTLVRFGLLPAPRRSGCKLADVIDVASRSLNGQCRLSSGVAHAGHHLKPETIIGSVERILESCFSTQVG